MSRLAMDRWVALLALMLLATAHGCDRRNAAAPQASVPPATMPELAPRPTMQELLAGPYQKFVAPGIPISIQAPKSWKINNASGLTVLEGQLPNEDMMIQVAARNTIKREDVDVFIDHMRREGERQPGTLKHMDVRNQGSAQIIEQVYEEKPISSPRTDSGGLPVTDASGNVAMTSVTPIHWMVTILVPGPKAYEHFDVNCIGLTTEQYSADKELLQRIMSSVAYMDSAAPATAP